MITQEQIFKAAGVKNKKELYKKFSTEEAFMAKCGGKIRKAQIGAVVSGGKKLYNPEPINFRDSYENVNRSITGYTDLERKKEIYKQQMLAAQQQQALAQKKVSGSNGGFMDIINQIGGKPKATITSGPLTEIGTDIPELATPPWSNKNGGKIPKAQWGEEYKFSPGSQGPPAWNGQEYAQRTFAPGINVGQGKPQMNTNEMIGEGIPIIGKFFGAARKNKEEKDEWASKKQWHDVTDLTALAAATRPEEIERKYVLPEDFEFAGGNLHNSYGNDTNILSTKNGGKISKAQSGGGVPWDKIGNFGSQVGLSAHNYNAGSMYGDAVGDVANLVFPGAGKFIKPVASLVGGFFDKKPKKIKNEQWAINKNIWGMAGGKTAQGVQQMNDAHMQDGGDVAMNGDLQVYNGDVETISTNRYLPGGGQTVQFNGPSHKDGGQRISFGNSPVEVEGGETGVKLEDGGQVGDESLTIFGNLKIPKNMLEDPLAKNKKFKNYDKILSKKEESLNKLATKNTIKLGEANSFTRFGKIKEDTLKLIDEGVNMKLKDLAQRKMDAAALQNAINDTAKEQGIVADDLAKGKYKVDKKAIKEYAKWGASLKKLEDGDPVKKDDEKVARKEAERMIKEEGWEYADEKKDKLVKKGEPSKTVVTKKETKTWITGENPDFKSKPVGDAPGGEIEDHSAWRKGIIKKIESGISPDELRAKKWIGPNNHSFDKYWKGDPNAEEKDGEKGYWKIGEEDVKNTEQGTPDKFMNVFDPEKPKVEEEEEKTKFPWMAYANQALEYLRPSDAEGLDPNQLAGELYSMANNQEEGVPAQGYRPQLDVPYDISLQDQLNEITASERATQKLAGYNPAFSAMVASQAYGPKSKVLADQFRLNQAMKDKVYSGNRALMNDAQLKNLAIFDQQYTRQAQAKSNTKEAIQLALNSVAGKYSQNKLENRTLGVYENMYKYRFDKDGRAINMNPFYEFNYDGNQGLASTDVQKMRAEAREKAIRDVIRAEEREKAKYEYQGTGDIPPNANQSYNSKYGRMGKNGISIPKALKDY